MSVCRTKEHEDARDSSNERLPIIIIIIPMTNANKQKI